MIYRYEINFWNEETAETTLTKGICGGKDYGDAINKIVHYYGLKNVVDIKIFEIWDVMEDDDLKFD